MTYRLLKYLVVVLILITGYLLLDSAGVTDVVSQKLNPPPKRVGIVNYLKQNNEAIESFKKKMLELGYKEGVHVIYDSQIAEGDINKTNSIVQEYVDKNVDMIYTVSSVPARAAIKITKDSNKTHIPIVFAFADEPVKTKLINALNSSGNNSAGVGISFAEVTAERLDLLKKLMPKAKKIGVFISKTTDPAQDLALKKIREYAPSIGLTAIEYTLTKAGDESVAEMKKIAENIKEGEIDALFRIPGPITGKIENVQLLYSASKKLNIPISGSKFDELELGALYVISYDLPQTGERAALIADKIFRGAKPSEVPSEFAQSVLALNLKAAREFKIDVPQDIIQSAKIKLE